MFKREHFQLEKPIAVNYGSPSGLSCIQVYTPDALDHLYLLQGLVAALTKPDFWQGTEAYQAQMSYLWEVAYETTDWSNCVPPASLNYGSRFDLWARYAFTFGFTLLYSSNVAQPYAHYVSQSTAALGNTLTFNTLYLRPGTWEFRGVYAKAANSAIASIILDDQSGVNADIAVASVDMHGLFLANQVVSATFVVPAEYPANLFVVATSKNAGSTNYFMSWTSFHFWRTGD